MFLDPHARVPALHQGRRRRTRCVAQRSREILQRDRQINAIRRRLTKNVLSAVKDLQTDRPEGYRTFWTQFGRVLKEGLLSDFDNQDILLRVSSFASTRSDEEVTTLAEYVERMKDGQQQIFYATGETRQQLVKSPHLEAFKAHGYEVPLLTDAVDEVWVGPVTDFDGTPLQSVAKGEVDLDSEEDKDGARGRATCRRATAPLRYGYRSRGGAIQFPPSALRANAAAAGLTTFRRAQVTG